MNIPIIKNLETIKDAFQILADEHTRINYFMFGNVEDLITEARTKLKYPCLMLEIPDIKIKDNDADYRYYTLKTGFVVLENKSQRTSTKENRIETLDKLALICEQIISRLYYESVQNRQYQFKVMNDFEQIDTITQDGDIGWRVEFEITRNAPINHNLAVWIPQN